MTVLANLIEENKGKFTINKELLDNKVSYKISTYDLVLPPVNAESIYHSRIRKYYKTLHALIIDTTDKLSKEAFKIDSPNTTSDGNVSVWGSAPSCAQYSMVTVVQGCLVARQYAASILIYSHAQQGHWP